MEGFKVVAETINIIGIMILIFGFSKELIKYLMAEFKGGIMLTPIKDIQKIRCQLGVYILLALDFLIASDIILSIVELSMEELIKLSERDDIYQILSRSVAPSIWENEDVKKGILC